MRLNKLLNSKKGIEVFTVLLVVVIGVVVLVVLSQLISKVVRSQDEQAYNSRCYASVIAYSKLNSIPMGDAYGDEADIDCPTRFVDIADGKAHDMKRDVADLMYYCWRNFGAGNLYLFDTNDDKFCAICSVFEFDDKDADLNGFTSFLMTEHIPVESSKGYRPTYYEYVTGGEPSRELLFEASKADEYAISASQRYAVVYTYHQQGYWNKVFDLLVADFFMHVAVVSAGTLAFPLAIPAVDEHIDKAIEDDHYTLGLLLFGHAGGALIAAALDDLNPYFKLGLIPYNSDALEQLGCDELPVSMVEDRFK